MHTYKPTAEYGEVLANNLPRSERETIDKVHTGRHTYYLVRATAGYEIAGSAMRWTDEYYAVEVWVDGARHGRRHKTLEEAREDFEWRVERAAKNFS